MVQFGRVVTAEELNEAIKKNNLNNCKILDCTYFVDTKPDPVWFREHEYGKFEILMEKETPQKQAYAVEHIPGAIFFDLDCAMYPGEIERFSFYPKEIFQEYIRALGINENDHLILYSRGPAGGNMFAARVFHLFQIYGQEKLSLLSGGFGKWKELEFPVEHDVSIIHEKGNWTAKCNKRFIIDYHVLTKKDSEGKDLFDGAGNTITILDGRPEAQFKASHLKGFQNLPLELLINSDGTIKSKEDVMSLLEKLNIKTDKQIVTTCLTGTQASLISFVFENILNKETVLYNGSLIEIQHRDPSRIVSSV
ncbi:Sulfurtransferase [Strongyloides ratti]|uniref:Sulfurtransferase n=1 Tax=Strongyloides ratti TaxID=34506 RepID=A0A090LL30_STRRB|nr:Sulfurtransferase [Strongyloides ratti]CEF70534.1 Sulfurtransferase [Strongyloides ratti]